MSTNQVYISFNDSRNDPTYSDLNGCSLIEHDPNLVDDDDANPCVEGVVRKVNLPIDGVAQVKAFASMMGWGYDFDNEGQILLYTGEYKNA